MYDKLVNKKVFHFFEEISKIPHCSFNEKKLSDYLVKFAKERNLECYQDKALNVIIKKDATEGYQNIPAVILQGHIDMVCEKNSDTIHDFNNEGIKHILKKDMLFADGTTLGADNGIAVAMMLAILDSTDINHPKLECLFTVQEEVGLLGAQEIEADKLDGKYLINIDSEEEGTFLVSCAGGCRVDIKIPVQWTEVTGEHNFIKIKIHGLKGGHSGMSIHEERGNSIKLISRLLTTLSKKHNIEIQSISSGSQDNAIPREAIAIVAIDKDDINNIQSTIEKITNEFNIELRGKDNNLLFELEVIETDNLKVLNQNSKLKLLSLIALSHNGVYSMSYDIHGLVESSKNIGIFRTEEDNIQITYCIRSSVESLLDAQIDDLTHLSTLLSGSINVNGIYPGWEYNPTSKLRDMFKEVYQEMYNKKPKIEAVHAGLECGILKKKLGEIDIISLGPDIFDPHSPNEHVDIQSVDRVHSFILNVLKKFN